MVLIALLAGMGCASAAQSPAAPAARPEVEVDAARGEVRIPGWFVNASRKLEVLACHESGPTHETVLAFRAEGEEIHRALQQAGFRGPSFWNATSPRDLRLTGGDRAMVWVRWEWKGTTHERPAEEILREEDTGLPLFVRGFTFAAEPVMMGDPPRKAIPREVEITIGGKTRQSAVFSLLYHPNDLPEMVPWASAPEVDPGPFPDLTAMVEARSPCSLIVRRLRGEEELVKALLSRETAPARKAVRERQIPLAREIDGRKREFEALVGEVRALLVEGEKQTDLSEEDRRRFAGRIRALSVRGGRLAAQVREGYLRLWALEEEHRMASLDGLTGLDARERAGIVEAHRSGFRFELALAAKRSEAAAAIEGAAAAEDFEGLLRQALRAEEQALLEERERRWARFRLVEEVRPKLKELDPKDDAYVLELFREDELRTLADLRSLRARVESAHADALEARARAGGGLARVEKDLARWRERIAVLARLGEAERRDAEWLEKIRWARNPPGGEPGPKELEDARRLEAEHRGVVAGIGALRVEARKVLGEEGSRADEVPRGLLGEVLYPEGKP